VLVPFPAAADDHQRHNAMALVQQGAAVLVEEKTLATESGRAAFVDMLVSLTADASKREAMRTAMRSMAKPDAADVIVTRLLELAA